jgi:hypothetical protein
LPERSGAPACYKYYQPKFGGLTRVYGGSIDQGKRFDSRTLIDVGLLETGHNASISGPLFAYIARGSGFVNGTPVSDGDLIRGEDLTFGATEDAQLIVVDAAQCKPRSQRYRTRNTGFA